MWGGSMLLKAASPMLRGEQSTMSTNPLFPYMVARHSSYYSRRSMYQTKQSQINTASVKASHTGESNDKSIHDSRVNQA